MRGGWHSYTHRLSRGLQYHEGRLAALEYDEGR